MKLPFIMIQIIRGGLGLKSRKDINIDCGEARHGKAFKGLLERYFK